MKGQQHLTYVKLRCDGDKFFTGIDDCGWHTTVPEHEVDDEVLAHHAMTGHHPFIESETE